MNDEVGSAITLHRSSFIVHRFMEGCDHIEIQRLAGAARLLGAIQNRNLVDRWRQNPEEVFDRKRSEQADLDDTDLLAARHEVLRGLFGSLSSRAHSDDDTLGIRRTHI